MIYDFIFLILIFRVKNLWYKPFGYDIIQYQFSKYNIKMIWLKYINLKIIQTKEWKITNIFSNINILSLNNLGTTIISNKFYENFNY